MKPDYPKITPVVINNETVYADNTQQIKAKQQYDNYQKEQKDYLYSNGKVLKTVTITGVKGPKKPDLPFSSNLNGPGRANQILMYDKLSNCVTLSECLNGKLFGVTFGRTDVEGRRLPYLMREQSRFKKAPPMNVIIDGIILDGTHLDDVNTNDIYSIEVLRSGEYLTIYGSNTPGGAIVITTKMGGEKGTVNIKEASSLGLISFPYIGFYKSKAFYSPKYEHKADNQTDMRTTVYWNPNIITDKDGNASFEYFNNDTKGTYRVVIEGIDDNGNLGRQVYRYKVE
jgi:hypothetical protein